MTDTPRPLDINRTDDRRALLEELDAAVDMTSDEARRTAITAGGKIIAAVVTAEDLQRLETLDAAAYGSPEFWRAARPASWRQQLAVPPPASQDAITRNEDPLAAPGMIARLAQLLFTLWQLADAAPSFRDDAAIERWLRDGRR